jgi:hypothetical protein
MTPDQLTALKSELQNDPKAIGYGAMPPSNPMAIVNLINAPTQSMIKQITSAVAMTWAAAGPYAEIVDAANNAQHPCRSSCLVVQQTFASGQDIHLEDPKVKSMFDAWVTADLITQAQQDSLMALSNQIVSRAQVIGLPEVTYKDVCDVFWNIDGSLK